MHKGKKSMLLKAAKKAIKRKIALITAGALGFAIVYIVLPILGGGLVISVMTGVLGRTGSPEADVIQQSDYCPCGCVAVNSNIGADGSYGFSTGSLVAGSLEEQALQLMKYACDKKGISNFRPYTIWVHLAVETSLCTDGKLSRLYESAPASIYDDLMICYDNQTVAGVNRQPKNEVFKGDPYTYSSTGVSIPVGPFQILGNTYESYCEYVTPEEIQKLGGTDPGFASRANQKGHPLYLPDVLNKLVENVSAKVVEGSQWLETWAPDKYEQLTDDGKYFACALYEISGYYGTPMVVTSYISEDNIRELAGFMCDMIAVWCQDPDGMYNLGGGAVRWNQAGYSDNQSMKELCEYIANMGYDNHWDEYVNWVGKNERRNANHYKAVWPYMACGFNRAMHNFNYACYGRTSGYCDGKFSNSLATVNSAIQIVKPKTNSEPLDWSKTILVGDSQTVGLGKWTEAENLVGHINAGTGRTLNVSSTGNDSTETVADVEGWKTIVMALGINSVNETDDTFENNYRTILELLKTKNPDATIFVCNILPIQAMWTRAAGYDLSMSAIQSKNKIIARLARDEGAELIDSYTEMKGYGIDDFENYVSQDGLHLNVDGYNRWWDYIKFHLEEYYYIDPDSQSIGSNSEANTILQGTTWKCNCIVPCPYCHCHDDGVVTGVVQHAVAGKEPEDVLFPDPSTTLGTASGIWGTTEELKEWVRNGPDISGGIKKSAAQAFMNYLGQAPRWYTANNWDGFSGEPGGDRYAGSDGLGFIVYTQGKYNGKFEEYNLIEYNYDYTLWQYGCGAYSIAMIMSTLEKKWVNPAEVMVAMYTSPQRTGHTCTMANTGPTSTQGAYCLFKQAGYKVETGLKCNDCGPASDKVGFEGFTKERLDACIDSGGMLMYVTSDSRMETSRAHWIVIRDRKDNGNYLVGNSCWPTSQPHKNATFDYSWDDIRNNLSRGDKSQFLFVYGKEPGSGVNASQVVNSSSNGPSVTYSVFGYNADGTPKGVRITSDIGRGLQSSVQPGQFHGGVDCVPDPANTGANPVYAVADGVVKVANYGTGSYERGYICVIEHDQGGKKWCSLYQHLESQPQVRVGMPVTAGTMIGIMGGSGGSKKTGEVEYTYAAHLHFEAFPCSFAEAYQNGTFVGNVVDGMALIGGVSTLKPQQVKYDVPTKNSVFDLTTFNRKYTKKDNTTYRQGTVVKQGIDYNNLVARYGDGYTWIQL